MKLRHLHYFVKIVDAGSFSRASVTVHVAQPALSHQIAELEEELGVTLLERSARGVRPTSAGDVLYREAVAILRKFEQLPSIVRSAGGPPEGPVNLGMVSTLAAFFSAQFAGHCNARLPKVSLSVVAGDSLALESRLSANTLDLALVFEDEQRSGFVRKALFRQRFYLIRHGPRSDGRDAISIKDLESEPLVAPAHPNLARSKTERAFAAAGIAPRIVAEFNIMSSLLDAVDAGLGSLIAPTGDLSSLPGHGDIVSIPIEPPFHVIASVLASNSAPLTRAGQAVRDLLIEFVAAQLRKSPLPGSEWMRDEAIVQGDSSRDI